MLLSKQRVRVAKIFLYPCTCLYAAAKEGEERIPAGEIMMRNINILKLLINLEIFRVLSYKKINFSRFYECQQ